MKRILIGTSLFLALAGASVSAPPETDEVYQNLKLVPGSKAATVYADPEADFKRYTKFIILEPYVAFKKNWKRDHWGVSTSDMERIKRSAATLFLEEFQEVLDEGGFPVVQSAGPDVLILRPALLDLDVSAPDVGAGRKTSFVASAGAVTLYMEFLDSESGAMVARVADRKAARDRGQFNLATSVYNSAEGRAIFKYWAGLLRDRFREIQAGTPAPAQ